jgi:hypothetical protein
MREVAVSGVVEEAMRLVNGISSAANSLLRLIIGVKK